MSIVIQEIPRRRGRIAFEDMLELARREARARCANGVMLRLEQIAKHITNQQLSPAESAELIRNEIANIEAEIHL